MRPVLRRRHQQLSNRILPNIASLLLVFPCIADAVVEKIPLPLDVQRPRRPTFPLLDGRFHSREGGETG